MWGLIVCCHFVDFCAGLCYTIGVRSNKPIGSATQNMYGASLEIEVHNEKTLLSE